MVTNYEKSIFNVYQSEFDDNAEQHIVAIPTANKTSQHTPGRAGLIGVSVGCFAFVLLSVLAIIWAITRKRKAHRGNIGAVTLQSNPLLPQSVNPVAMEVQEIDMNSLIGFYRELPDSGKA